MSTEDKVSRWVPTYLPVLHQRAADECREAWGKGRPWTHLRVLEPGVDASEGAACGRDGCSRRVEAVQYTSAFGEPVFYCADHAVEREGWDTSHYDSRARPVPEMPKSWHDEVARVLRRIGPKKRREEPEEIE